MISSAAIATDISTYKNPEITLDGENLQVTETPPSGPYFPLTSKEITGKTDHEMEESPNSFKFTSVFSNVNDTPPHIPSVKKEVDAVITSVEEYTVLCEVLLDTGNIEIQLPKTLIPEKPFYGMPISISLDESSGYTVPMIRRRVVPPESKEYGKTKIDALIDSL